MKEPSNPRLRAQLTEHFGSLENVPRELAPWIDDIDRTYHGFESDQRSLELTLDRSLAELRSLRSAQGKRDDSAARAAQAEQLAVTLRSIGDGVITAASSGEVLLMNRVAEELTGWRQDEAEGEALETVLHVVDRSPGPGFPQSVDDVSQETLNVTGILMRRDGSRVAIATRMSPMHDRRGKIVGVVVVFRDVTEERRREQERLRASKIESVGILAGGIAHDFNNFLTVILGNLSLACEQLAAERPERARTAELLARSETAARQARDLTQQLLTFSRGGSPVKKTASAGELIEECASFALRGSNVRCDLEISADLRPVEIDRGQIAQVLHNLIINADQAMPGGGVIEIRADNETVEPFAGRPMRPGDYVRIAVADRGTGIARRHLEKIFDPYFTTKEGGTGLGLATAYSIAKNHKGWIGVDSEEGRGSVFTVYLPAAPAGAKVEESSTQERRAEGRGRLLVMDDDPAVRAVARDMLAYLGHEVECAGDGEETLELYRGARERGRPFDAVIMDLTIPGGMGGREAVEKLLEIDPEARVVVASGYSNDPIMAEYESYGFRAVLRKPFDVEELSRVLDEVRDDPQVARAAED